MNHQTVYIDICDFLKSEVCMEGYKVGQQFQCQTAINQQKIQLFISVTDQVMPDVVVNSEQIFSEFKFFFNDESIVLWETSDEGGPRNLMYLAEFEQSLKSVHQLWIRQNIGHPSHSDSFVAFLEFWVSKQTSLYVEYQSYEDVVTEEVQSFYDQQVRQILSNSKRMHLKTKKTKPSKQLHRSPMQAEQRLMYYFDHLAGYRQNTACKNTFDELDIAFSSLDLSQWIRFLKEFKTVRHHGAINRLSTNRVKNIFNAFCRTNKTLDFEQFRKALQSAFQELFNEQYSQDQYHEFCKWLKIYDHDEFKQQMNQFGVCVPKAIYRSKDCVHNKYKYISSKYMRHQNNPHQLVAKTNTEPLINLKSLQSKQSRIVLKPVEAVPTQVPTTKSELAPIKIKPKYDHPLLSLESQPDEFLDRYSNKQRMCIFRTIDSRINKITKPRQHHLL